MQQFIDNWSATLLAPITNTSLTLSVEPAKAALLTGLGGGAFYRLTLVELDGTGAEVDWDVVQVTAVAGGVLTVTRTGTARSWADGTLIEARLTAAGMGELRDAAGVELGDAAPLALGSASAGTSALASREDHQHPAPTPGDIGAATAAQGDKADTAVQPAALATALADKVDKEAGKGLSSNDFTSAEKTKLAGVAAGATANADTDSLAEGVTNQYFTEPRVRSTVLTGLSLLAGGVITAADSVLSALGRLQKQISDAVTAIGEKQDTLVSGTSLKTVNGNSLLGSGDIAISGGTQCIPIACSDETTALTAGSAKVTFRMPYAFTLSAVRASLTTAQASGSILTVDINEGAASILSTKLTIDNTEKTSTTAVAAAVISDSALANDAEITIDIDQVGDGTATGLKVYLIGVPE